ncbi:MAG: tetratricopeptide repeat-containing glycosyltransferase family protein [Acetobacteraceae bacterium]
MGSAAVDPAWHAAVLEHVEHGRLGDAAVACEAVLAVTPDDWLALRLLGLVRHRQGALEPASQLLLQALRAAPPDTVQIVALLNELADTLRARLDFDTALECYRQALAQKPDDAATLRNFADMMVSLNRHGEALALYRAARAVTPEAADLQVDEAMTMLTLGMWLEAWGRFESRLSLPPPYAAPGFPADVPHWRGHTDIAGKTILLHAEQGLGDTLQFVRYVAMVAERGAHIVLRVQPVLRKLLAGLPGVGSVIGVHDPVPPVDLQCPLMSLPYAFGTTLENVPARIPYLRAAPEYLMVWRALLGLPRKRRVGLVWTGRPVPAHRSMPLATFAPLLARPDLEVHVLQPQMSETERAWLAAHGSGVVDHSPDLRDFADTAALVSCMDLIVTIDTSVAHLAGALGVPVWIILPFSADWRWLAGRSDTPWYPTARLFRQTRPRHWESAVAQVMQALSEWTEADQRPPGLPT